MCIALGSARCQKNYLLFFDTTAACRYGMLDPSNKDSNDLPLTIRAVFIIGPDKKLKLSLNYPASVGRNMDEIVRCIDALQLSAKHSVVSQYLCYGLHLHTIELNTSSLESECWSLLKLCITLVPCFIKMAIPLLQLRSIPADIRFLLLHGCTAIASVLSCWCCAATLHYIMSTLVSLLVQATPANWPYNHDSIGKKGWAFLLPTVSPEDAKLHFPDHHSCKVITTFPVLYCMGRLSCCPFLLFITLCCTVRFSLSGS